MEFLDRTGLKTFLDNLKPIFGLKVNLETSMDDRRKYLLDYNNYEEDLSFNTDWIVGNNSPYVGSAVVGSTYLQ